MPSGRRHHDTTASAPLKVTTSASAPPASTSVIVSSLSFEIPNGSSPVIVTSSRATSTRKAPGASALPGGKTYVLSSGKRGSSESFQPPRSTIASPPLYSSITSPLPA